MALCSPCLRANRPDEALIAGQHCRGRYDREPHAQHRNDPGFTCSCSCNSDNEP